MEKTKIKKIGHVAKRGARNVTDPNRYTMQQRKIHGTHSTDVSFRDYTRMFLRNYIPLILLSCCTLIIVTVTVVLCVVLGANGAKGEGDSTKINVATGGNAAPAGKQDEAATTTTTTFLPITPEYCLGDADVVLIFDASASIFSSSTRTWDNEKMIMRRVVEKLPIHKDQVRVALILLYSDALESRQNKKALEYAIETMPCTQAIYDAQSSAYCGGGTDTVAAFRLALQEFKDNGKTGGKKILMIVTDGKHDSDNDQEIKSIITDLNSIYVDIYASTESSDYDNNKMLLYTRQDQAKIFVRKQALNVVDDILNAAGAKKCSEISQG